MAKQFGDTPNRRRVWSMVLAWPVLAYAGFAQPFWILASRARSECAATRRMLPW
jgi:hypothetical protein